MPSCGVCPSVRLSDTFVHSDETNKHIFKFFSPPGSHTILVFSYPTLWQYSDVEPPNGGVERRWGRHKSRFSTNSLLSIDDCCNANNNCDRPPCSLPHRRRRISEFMFITTSMDDRDEEKRTGQNLCSDKSEAIIEDCAII